MQKKKLITVVVPIYNVEQYLRQCLDSLLYQTLDNHYVIMVNDGSKDSSGEIAQEYAEKHPDMFRYVEQENAGLGAARNTGIRLTETEMITFLDSDDWLNKRFIEKVSQRVAQEGVLPDIIYTLPVIFDASTNQFMDWHDKELFESIFAHAVRPISPKQDPRILALEPSANRKVYRMELFRRHSFAFPEGTKWEDVEPHFQMLHYADRIIGEGSVGFVYRINTGGQITSSVGPDRLQVVSVFTRALNRAREEHWSPVEILYIIRMLFSFSRWSISFSNNKVRAELVPQLHELFCSIPGSEFKAYCAHFHVGRKDRMFIWLLRSRFHVLLSNPVYYDWAKLTLDKLAGKLRLGR